MLYIALKIQLQIFPDHMIIASITTVMGCLENNNEIIVIPCLFWLEIELFPVM